MIPPVGSVAPGWRALFASLVFLALPGAVGAQTYTLDAEVRTETSATLTLSGHSGAWHHKRQSPTLGSCEAVTTGNSADLTGLEPGQSYTYHVFNNQSCAAENRLGDAEAAFRTYNFRFVNKTHTTATLKLENYPADQGWWYKETYLGGDCTPVTAGTTTVTATGLTKNTSYTFNAYGSSGCSSADGIGVVYMKTTPVNALYADDVKQTTATLRLTDPPDTLNWWYKRTAGPGAPSSCASAGDPGTATVSLTSLAGDGAYTYRAYRSNQCAGKNDEIDWISFTTPDLTASGVGPAYATLTVANHTGKWWHRKTDPASPAGSCVAVAAGTSTAALNDLLGGTNYSWAAYSEADCPSGKKFASRTFTTTPAVAPPAPANPGLNVTGGEGAVTLKASLPHHGGSPIIRWEYIKKEGGNPWETTWRNISGTSRTLSHTVSGLTNGTEYKFKVRAVNDNGEGAESGESAAVTPSTTPAKPTGLTVSGGNGTVTLSWTAGSDGGSAITGWKYTKKTGNDWDSGWTAVPNSGAGTTSYTVQNLTNGTEYTFKVRAVNVNGDGAESDESDEVTPSIKPAKPTGLTVSGANGTVTLSWTAGSDGGSAITGWKYTKKAGNSWDSGWTAVPNSGASTTSYTVPSLTNGTEYKFKVRAVNANGDGAESDESGAVTPSTTPAKPTGLTVSGANGTVTLSWTAGSDGGSAITGWKYTKKAGNSWDSGWTAVPNSGASTTSYTAPDLTNGTEYKFKVRAVNANGDGAESDESGAVTPSTTPAKPTGLTVSGANGTATLSWTAGSDGGSAITGWKYTKKTDNSWDSGWTAVPNSGASTTSYTVPDLTNGTEYKFKVRAVNANGDGAESDESGAVTPSTTPAKPTGLTVSGANGTATLSWTAGSDGGSAITGWKYTKKTGNDWDGGWTAVPNSGASTTSYTVPDLTNGTEYKFKVRAVNANGDGAESDESGAVTPSTTPPQPTKPSVAAGDRRVTLSGSSVADTGGSAITKWQYAYKSKPSGGNYGSWGGWNDIAGTSTTMPRETVSGLTNGTEYKFRVRAVNARGDGADSPESDAVKPTPAPVLSITNRTATGATLNLANHNAAWHYKANKAPDSSCKGPVSNGTATKAVTGLSPTTSYTYTAYGDSSCSNSLDAAPAFTTLPDAPSKPSVAAGNQNVTLSGAKVGSGTTVTKWQYAYKSKPSGGNYGSWGGWNDITGTSTTMPRETVSSLTNGTEYKFKVRAVNGTDSSAGSPESDAATPSTKPAKPTGLTVSGGNGTVALSWTAGSNGGSAITGWKYIKKTGNSWDSGWTVVLNGGAGTTSYTVPSLTNGTVYKFKVRAVNANGDGAESDESGAVTPSTTPAKPTGLTVSRGNGSATLSWTAGSGGGSAITGWKYIKKTGNSWDGDWTAVPNSGAGTTNYTVPDLTNGTVYKFKVRAVNANGDGAESDESGAVTPAATPARPTGLTVSGADRTVTLSWTAGSNGGSAITGWKYTRKTGNSWDGGWTAVPNSGASTTSYTVPDLTNGTEYTFKVRAVNAVGDGAESDESAAVTPSTKPAKPTGLTVAGGNGTATLSWTAGSDGGSAITGWKYTKKTGNDWDSGWTAVPNSGAGTTSYTVQNLTNGTEYRFKVRAVNARGDGAESDESDAVTPATPSATPPPAPTKPSVAAGAGSVTLNGSSVADTGGSAIARWQYAYKSRPSGGNYGSWGDWNDIAGTSTAMPSKTVSGLTNGTEYTFKVRAVNARGNGADSPESDAVTPGTTPPAPTKPSVAAGGGSVTLSGSSVADTGGSAIAKWQYAYKFRPSGGNYGGWGGWNDITGTSTAMPSETVSGLTNGTEYKFKVRAVNARGDGPDSPESDGVKLAARPSSPAAPTLTEDIEQLRVSWTEPGNNGAAIFDYDVRYRAENSGDWTSYDHTGTETACTITGLTGGQSYQVQVRATNLMGPGSWSATATGTPSAAPAERLGRVSAALAPEAARAMASSATAAVSERLRRAGSGEAGPPPTRMLAERLAAHGEGLEDGTASLREAFAGASLSLPLAAAERGGGVSGAGLWASGDWRDLSGGGLPLAWDGAMAALHLGADARLGSGLVGLALSVSEASFDYADGSGDQPVAGEYTVRMTGLRPYWGRSWADGSRLWATAGLSSGEVEIEDAEAGRRAADGGMASLAAGGALRLLPAAERGAPSLDLKGEALVARLEVEGDGGAMEAVDAGVSRLRVALASETEIEAGPGMPLVPSAELGLVWDGGDGETGAGLELGWGLSWTVPARGLTLDARARALLGHGGEREEWGAGGGLRLDQGASGRGASFGLALSLGHAEGGAARLWEEGAAAAAGDREGERPPARLDAEGGYGMAAPGLSGGLLTPYAGAGLEDGGGRRYRMGVRLEGGAAARLSLEGARSDGADGNSGREATLRVEMRW